MDEKRLETYFKEKKMGIGLVMYGAGKRCIGLYKVLTSLGITILLIVDSDNKSGEQK